MKHVIEAAAATVAVSFALLWATGCQASGDDGRSVRVFGAASLTDVLEVMADSFESKVGGAASVKLHLAGSSLLARQIEFGAGADVFVSAHPSWTDHLYRQGLLREPQTLPITNRLLLVSRDSSVTLRNVRRLALADPDHVPAGVYAKAALECALLWNELSGRVVAVVDVRGALAAVDEGAADAAVVYESDVRFAPHLHAIRPFQQDCEPDVVYTMGLAREADDLAVQFGEQLLDSSLASTWAAFGFSPGRSIPW